MTHSSNTPAGRRPPMVEPSVWFNGYDYVVALSAEDASALIAIHFGEESHEARRGDRLDLWTRLPHGEAVILWVFGRHIAPYGVPGSETMVRPAQYWAHSFGIGYLASVKE